MSAFKPALKSEIKKSRVMGLDLLLMLLAPLKNSKVVSIKSRNLSITAIDKMNYLKMRLITIF